MQAKTTRYSALKPDTLTFPPPRELLSLKGPAFMRGYKALRYLTNLSGDTMALLLAIYCATLLVQASLCAGAQTVFQVYQPVSANKNRSTGCNEDVLLMEHVFAASYGKPFVGKYGVERSIEKRSC